MLDIYELGGDIWLCHSVYRRCYDFTAFVSTSEMIFQIEYFYLDLNVAVYSFIKCKNRRLVLLLDSPNGADSCGCMNC